MIINQKEEIQILINQKEEIKRLNDSTECLYLTRRWAKARRIFFKKKTIKKKRYQVLMNN